MPIRNVLIDRDGTIIVEKHYLHDPAQVELVPGAGQALARLAGTGMRLFVVTNQSGIGRGYYTPSDFQAVGRRLDELLAPYGVRFTDVVHCPHAPADSCSCRKPEPGMWQDLSARHGLLPGQTAMIGDNASDVAFGAGCGLAESVLVLTGHGARFAAELGLPDLEGGWMRLEAAPCPVPASRALGPTEAASEPGAKAGHQPLPGGRGPGATPPPAACRPTALARDLAQAADYLLRLRADGS